MSDPMSNIDIEDVLTSIRRLVREGGGATDQKAVLMGPGSDRTASGPLDAAQPAPTAGPGPDNSEPTANPPMVSQPPVNQPTASQPTISQPGAVRPSAVRPGSAQANSPRQPTRFVLTPALRVTDAPPPVQSRVLRVADTLPHPAVRLAPAPPPAAGAVLPPLQRHIPISDSRSPTSDRLLPIPDDAPLPQNILGHMDTLRALADHSNRPLDAFDFASVLHRPLDFVTDGPAGGDDAPAADDQPDLTPADTQPDFRLRLADTAAGLEAAVTAQPDDWEPDGSEDVPVMDWSRAAPEDAPVFRSRHTAPLRLETRVDAAPAQPVSPPPLDAAEMPHFRHRDRVDGGSDETTDHSGPAGSGNPANPDPAIDITEDLAAYLGRDHMVDEGALRALIVEIVRQELQGSLGERITRNVRKLVRREISRMLTSEEFE